MTDNDASGPVPQDEDAVQAGPEEPESAEDPGYLTTTGETVGEDGSVVPIIGGLPAAEGSAWDIGAPLEDRGAGLADELGGSAGQDDQDAHGS
jgi:hypothetical protein